MVCHPLRTLNETHPFGKKKKRILIPTSLLSAYRYRGNNPDRPDGRRAAGGGHVSSGCLVSWHCMVHDMDASSGTQLSLPRARNRRGIRSLIRLRSCDVIRRGPTGSDVVPSVLLYIHGSSLSSRLLILTTCVACFDVHRAIYLGSVHVYIIICTSSQCVIIPWSAPVGPRS